MWKSIFKIINTRYRQQPIYILCNVNTFILYIIVDSEIFVYLVSDSFSDLFRYFFCIMNKAKQLKVYHLTYKFIGT